MYGDFAGLQADSYIGPWRRKFKGSPPGSGTPVADVAVWHEQGAVGAVS
jgi:hypothetical protein